MSTVVLLLAACGSDSPASMGAGTVPDAGPPPATADRSPSTKEAGVPAAEEAGVPDAGPPEPEHPLDAGQPTADAGPAPNLTRVSLIDHYRWTPLDAEEDPFDDRLDEVNCPESALATAPLGGEISYDIDTGMCNYVTATQPTLVHVTPGETIQVRLWHFELSASEPAEAHVVLTVDGLDVLEEHVPIPSASGLITVEATVREFVPAGAPVLFHLHNHGENSWALIEVSTGV